MDNFCRPTIVVRLYDYSGTLVSLEWDARTTIVGRWYLTKKLMDYYVNSFFPVSYVWLTC